jgi:hypothetical protein
MLLFEKTAFFKGQLIENAITTSIDFVSISDVIRGFVKSYKL